MNYMGKERTPNAPLIHEFELAETNVPHTIHGLDESTSRPSG